MLGYYTSGPCINMCSDGWESNVPESIDKDIDEFRFHLDAMYIGGIPRLLDEAGAFLAFLTILTAV
jgi:hypothetical protein